MLEAGRLMSRNQYFVTGEIYFYEVCFFIGEVYKFKEKEYTTSLARDVFILLY